ncbi:MAG: cell division protein ZapA [Bacteroidetes bacterium]|jgi:cell division protein ZapA|nr:cell division protein ZapA [Bacteroidota bacterium]
MGEKSVKINIAGRTYPLKVDSTEEAFVHEAAVLINKRVAQLEAGFVVKDKQDLLALTALQFATQYLEAKTKVVDDKDGLLSSLTEIDALMDSYLAKSR